MWQQEAAQLQGSVTELALRLSAARVAAAGRLAAAVQVRCVRLTPLWCVSQVVAFSLLEPSGCVS